MNRLSHTQCLLTLALLVTLLSSCAQNAEKSTAPGTPAIEAAAPTPKVDVPKAELTAKGPVGLFFMTRYFAGNLEKAAWYFTPDGVAYENLLTGLSAEDLAAHKGRKGTLKMVGNATEITWPDGKKSTSPVEPDKTTFMWDMGIFSPVQPLGDVASLVGKYEGGESLSHGGNAVMVSRGIELRADGTYSLESVASVSGKTDQTKLSAGAQGGETGTWKIGTFTITLSGTSGAQRKLAFRFDDEKIVRLYLGGTLYKRQ